MTTPNKRSSRPGNPDTPGDTSSVVSRTSTGSFKPGVPRFLDDCVHKDPENFSCFGARGSEIRSKIGDLVQHWKKKSREQYRAYVHMKYQIAATRIRKAATPRPTKIAEDESVDSSLTSSEASKKEDNRLQSPLIGKTVSTVKKAAVKKAAAKKQTEAKKTPTSKKQPPGQAASEDLKMSSVRSKGRAAQATPVVVGVPKDAGGLFTLDSDGTLKRESNVLM